MSHKRLIADQIIALLEPGSQRVDPWHTEYELEEFLVRQGFDRDLVLDAIDDLIDEGILEFSVDQASGGYLIYPASALAEHSAS